MRLSTIGVKVGYAAETTAGEKPEAFTWIPDCNKIGGVKLTNDKIDVTCFEDKIKQYIQGIADTGGDWALTFAASDKLQERWKKCREAYTTAKASGKSIWWNVFVPSFGSFFIVAEPGEFPMPDLEPSSKMDVEMSLTINDYKGLGEAIEPTAA